MPARRPPRDGALPYTDLDPARWRGRKYSVATTYASSKTG